MIRPLLALPLVVLVASSLSCSGGETPTERTNPRPVVTGVSPDSLSVGSPEPLILTGSGFLEISRGRWNGGERVTTYLSEDSLRLAVTADDVSEAGPAEVDVVNPEPGGGTSDPVTVAVVSTNPVPRIDAVSPSVVFLDTEPVVLTLRGQGFIESSQATWNGAERETHRIDGDSLTVTLTATDVAAPAEGVLRVINPPPGGGTSNAFPLTVTDANPVPTLSSIDPDTVIIGTAFTLRVHGSGFIEDSRVVVNGDHFTPTFVSPQELAAEIPAQGTVDHAGNGQVRVVTPAPGGGQSATLTLVGLNPVPEFLDVAPDTISPGPASQLALRGRRFGPYINILHNGETFTRIPSDTDSTATLTVGPSIPLGVHSYAVANDPPHAGPSEALTVVVQDVAPSITMVSVGGAPVGTAQFVRVTGAGFSTNTVIRLDGVDFPTVFEGVNRVSATVSTAGLFPDGPADLTVYNPPPGGGESTPHPFNVYRLLDLGATDLAYDPAAERLYVARTDVGGGPNQLAVLSRSGEILESHDLTRRPTGMALTDDGQYVYLTLDAQTNTPEALTRFVTATGQFDFETDLGSTPGGKIHLTHDLSHVPGRPEAVAVALAEADNTFHGVVVYENGVLLPDRTAGGQGSTRLAASDTTGVLFGYDNLSTTHKFQRLEVDGEGVVVTGQTVGTSPLNKSNVDIAHHGGFLYSTDGYIIDAGTLGYFGWLFVEASVYPSLRHGGRTPAFTEARAVYVDERGRLRLFDLATEENLVNIDIGPGVDYDRLLRTVYLGGDRIAFHDLDGKVVILAHPAIAEQ